MNLALFIKKPIINKWFVKQLAYYANGWFLFENNSLNKKMLKSIDDSRALIVIVAKIHYTETWQSFSSVSKQELKKIIALQKSNESAIKTIFQIIENKSIDGFDVKKIIFDQQIIDILGEHRFLIPETELCLNEPKTELILSLETPQGKLFVSYTAGKSISSYAKGLMADINIFKLSSGLPSNIEEAFISKKQYGNFLSEQLQQKNFSSLTQCLSFNPRAWFKAKDLHLLYWAPLLTASFFYIISNSFLWLQSNNIEDELAEQGTQVSQLLENKRLLDNRNNQLTVLNSEFATTTTVHNHWTLIYHLVENGMTITRISFKNAIITVRGKSEHASKILAAIAQHSNVESATFKGAVRQSRGQDTFILELIPKKQWLTDTQLKNKKLANKTLDIVSHEQSAGKE